jgi:uncharacterized protein (TIRG00374 family)
MSTFGWRGCLLSMLFLSGQIVFMVFRYWALIPGEHSPSIFRVGYAVSVGQAVNNYFPARVGDLVKAALLTRDPRAALTGGAIVAHKNDRRLTFLKAIGLVVADRIVDVGTLILMVLLSGALFVPADFISADKLPSKTTAIAVCLVIAVFIFFSRRAVSDHVSAKLKKLTAWLREFRGGFHGMMKPKKLGLAIVFAALSWQCEILSLQTLSSMQGYPMTFTQAVFVLLALNFFISVPLTIANFGPFEAGVVMALQAVQKIPTEQALAVATVHHIAQMIAVTLVAFIAFVLVRFVVPRSVR